MALEVFVIVLALAAYLCGCVADERRARRRGKRLRRLRDETARRLRDEKAQRPRLPLPSSP